ncbi:MULTISPECIES: DoxX family protein [Parabacteroides]|uniref:DoxX family protein n=1 Tax=Parabacteroides provencensis TaxID=1944636 RepID=UPI000C161281|nr:DoxX family protein [Parabacteroides provencensis]
MSAIYRFLFPTKPDGAAISLLLLAFRILFGVLLMSHGLQKLNHFSEMAATFPDPLGVGHSVSLGLAIFGELFCSLGFIFGILYRLAMIPMIFTMCVAFFIVHGSDPFAVKELAFVYLAVFVIMYIAGPGKFSVDRLIAVALSKKH